MSIVTLNNRALKDATAVGTTTGLGDLVFISRSTASSSSSLSITSGIDSTYKEYIFVFNNIHPATDGANFQVNFRDGGSDYDATKTTTFFNAFHDEADANTGLNYFAAHDLAQSTSFQSISLAVGADNDQSTSGKLHLFEPSNTTFVKHFISQFDSYESTNYSTNYFVAGYCNVTAAIDGVQFKFSSGNIDSGTIDLYGVN
jgi:hypothetical protein